MSDVRELVGDVRQLEEIGVIELRDEEPSDDEEYCHIVDAGGKFYCGKPRSSDRLTCQRFKGEAICPTCGRPTCPTCAVRSDLAVRLEGT